MTAKDTTSGAEPSLIDVLGEAGIRHRSDFELEQLIDNRTLVGRSCRECEAELNRRKLQAIRDLVVNCEVGTEEDVVAEVERMFLDPASSSDSGASR